MQYDSSNQIHPTAIIDPRAKIGLNNSIGPYVLIGSNVRIGNGNVIMPFAVIGSAPEHKEFWFLGEDGHKGVIIGDNNFIREHVTINCGTTEDTIISNDCIFLSKAHVGHDCIIGSGTQVGCSSSIAGHVVIASDVYIGLNCSIHQKAFVPRRTCIGMNSVVLVGSCQEPGLTYVGSPVRAVGPNKKWSK